MDRIKIKDVNLLLLIIFLLTQFAETPLFDFFMIIVIFTWLSKNNLNLRNFLYFSKTNTSIILLSVLTAVLLVFASFFYYFYSASSIESIGERKLSLSLSFLWSIFVASVLGPLVEELFFRGILYNSYKKKGFLLAIILSSTFFFLIHFNYRKITIFIIGVYLALLYEITQCFWIPVLVHGSYNAFASVFFALTARFLQVFLYWLYTDNVWFFRIKLLLISIVLYILAILVMLLIMRISGNNIFQGKEFKNMKLINRDDSEPLIDKYLILVFVISVSMIAVRIVFFKPV
ncbi:MAG TPA: hypothetical protein DHV55_02310 [Clostridiaceae bacterium]|nr:hypothetical protein [Clostridiaceae bacterium]